MRGCRLVIAAFVIAGLAASPVAEAGCLTWFRRVLNWPDARLEERIEAVNAAIADIAKTEQTPFREWTCTKNACTAMSPQLAYHLKRRGFPVRLAAVQNRLPYVIWGKEVPTDAGHMFMVIEGEPPLIVDPTFKQFFNDGTILHGPHVFVGTVEQLRGIFRERRDHLVEELFHAYSHWDRSQIGAYDPDLFFDKTYGLGAAAGSRTYPEHYDSYGHFKRIVIEPEPAMVPLVQDGD